MWNFVFLCNMWNFVVHLFFADSERRGEGSAWPYCCYCGQSWEWQWAHKIVCARETPCADPRGVKWSHNASWIDWSACQHSEGNDCMPWTRFPESRNWKYQHEQPVKVGHIILTWLYLCTMDGEYLPIIMNDNKQIIKPVKFIIDGWEAVIYCFLCLPWCSMC